MKPYLIHSYFAPCISVYLHNYIRPTIGEFSFVSTSIKSNAFPTLVHLAYNCSMSEFSFLFLAGSFFLCLFYNGSFICIGDTGAPHYLLYFILHSHFGTLFFCASLYYNTSQSVILMRTIQSITTCSSPYLSHPPPR